MFVYTLKPVLRGHFGTKKKWPCNTGDLLKEVQFTWNFLWQDKKKFTFKYRWLLNRGDHMGRFNCIWLIKTLKALFRHFNGGFIMVKIQIPKIESIGQTIYLNFSQNIFAGKHSSQWALFFGDALTSNNILYGDILGKFFSSLIYLSYAVKYKCVLIY
jgi:hypothetical protein